MILTFSQERKGVTATFRKESSGRCDQMVVRPNAKAAKTLTPQCDLSPIWNLCATPHPRERSCAISTEYQTPNTKDRPRRHNSKNLHLLPNWHQAIASARSQADADPETTCVPAACGSPCCGSPDAPTVPAAGPRSDVRSCDRRHPNDTADRGQRGGSS